MGKKIVIKTKLKNPPTELMYCWREPYEVFPVRKDGTVEGLSIDHPRFLVLQNEWKLEVIEEDVGSDKKDKKDKKDKPDVGKPDVGKVQEVT